MNWQRSGKRNQARELHRWYRWYTPLLHLDTKIKLVQYIKLAMAEVGLGSETRRAPRLAVVGEEREHVLAAERDRCAAIGVTRTELV